MLEKCMLTGFLVAIVFAFVAKFFEDDENLAFYIPSIGIALIAVFEIVGLFVIIWTN